MKCLAVNTANSILSVALCDGDKTLYHFETPETRDQGNLLLFHAQKALDAASIGYDGLDMMAVVTGPGSFTGIRIGLAAMRALAMAAVKPLVGLSSFELFDIAPEPGTVCVVAVEAWREELYFKSGTEEAVNVLPAVYADHLREMYAGQKIVICGDAAEKLAAFLPEAQVIAPAPDARILAQKAVQKFMRDGAQSAAVRPAPFYLRDADVTISTGKNRNIEGQ